LLKQAQQNPQAKKALCIAEGFGLAGRGGRIFNHSPKSLILLSLASRLSREVNKK